MRIFERLFGALFALQVAIAPAAADSNTTPVTISGWQAIGTGTIIVQALSQEGVWLLDADAPPTAATGAVLIPYGAISPAVTAKSTWYAHAANSKSTTLIGVVNLAGPPLQSGGNVGGFDFQIAPAVTVQTAAYSAGSALGGVITAAGAARTPGGAGILTGLRLRSAGGATPSVWVYAWSKQPQSTCTDKAAFAPNAADSAYALVGFPQPVTLASPGSWDTASYASLASLVANFKNQDSPGGTALYFCLVTATSVTPSTTGDLALVVAGVQD